MVISILLEKVNIFIARLYQFNAVILCSDASNATVT